MEESHSKLQSQQAAFTFLRKDAGGGLQRLENGTTQGAFCPKEEQAKGDHRHGRVTCGRSAE